jgi:hypothetical protein
VHLVGYFHSCITILHGFMNVKLTIYHLDRQDCLEVDSTLSTRLHYTELKQLFFAFSGLKVTPRSREFGKS